MSVSPEKSPPVPTRAELMVSLGGSLVASGKLSARDLERAVSASQETNGKLGAVLVGLGLVSERDVAIAKADILDIPFVESAQFPEEMLEVPGLHPDFLRAHRALPVRLDGTSLTVALTAPEDAFLLKAIGMATGCQVVPCVALDSDIDRALNPVEAVVEDDETDDVDSGEFVEHLRDLASEAPTIRLVSQIIGRVVDIRASDIHLEPFDNGLHVRYRVDGVLDTAEILAPQFSAAISSRVKLMAHLDIAERRLPQDGRIKTHVKGKELDLRVSTAPTVHGESIVMRVLDRSSVRYSLDAVGFSKENLARFQQLLARPHGIFLMSGPTGSGKTTTLYTALSNLDVIASKIITVEDPVEYQLDGINQIQVHPQIGLTFPSALRSILRQDPDVIMIGEMRDSETAQIAVQSALTGHLVLSTLHTNTAAGAIVRLQDMGLEPYLITSALNGVLSQRLVRRLCEHCKFPHDMSEGLEHKEAMRRLHLDSAQVYKAVGCNQCRGTGYVGRCGIHELLVVDDALRTKILAGGDTTALHEVATQAGMRTLYEDGLQKVAAGLTSLEELLVATQDSSNA